MTTPLSAIERARLRDVTLYMGQTARQLALVTRDLILAFPVTYLAKTRLNLL